MNSPRKTTRNRLFSSLKMLKMVEIGKTMSSKISHCWGIIDTSWTWLPPLHSRRIRLLTLREREKIFSKHRGHLTVAPRTWSGFTRTQRSTRLTLHDHGSRPANAVHKIDVLRNVEGVPLMLRRPSASAINIYQLSSNHRIDHRDSFRTLYTQTTYATLINLMFQT